ncbi:MAG: hypothetical protein ACTSWN_14290 [Promethearchaeota archaeon]
MVKNTRTKQKKTSKTKDGVDRPLKINEESKTSNTKKSSKQGDSNRIDASLNNNQDHARDSETDNTSITSEIPEDLIENSSIKFWQQDETFRTLFDPDVIKSLDVKNIDLEKILNDFFSKMFKQKFIDFKVSGIAVHSAAKIYRRKIQEVLESQQKIEEARKREALKRQIPTALSQPLRGGIKIATQDEFIASMRRAIIEVMRKREKQQKRLMRKRSQEIKSIRKTKTKKRLPEGIRKAILGKERIEDTFDRWYSIIRSKARKSPDGLVSFINDLKPEIKTNNKYSYRFQYARLFMSLMFLRTRGKIDVMQEDELTDLYISLIK